ncbi:5-oxoprolinase subunit B [Achromobacter animicus]|uniref:5-oxoprolinase subunit B n=2 Tax=Achromobacter animicus TaxID=1389935 RepID=A0A6S6Z5B7_9BURK|nr:5-oxoprolinase subunit B [Achromobacter animicus]
MMTAAPISTPSPVPRIVPAGDRTLLIEFADRIDADTNAQVLALADKLRSALRKTRGLSSVVPAYRSLAVGFDPLLIGHGAVRDLIARSLDACAGAPMPVPRRWEVPVCYGGDHGMDLQALADLHQLAPAQLIARHTAPVYRVYMVGFLPGFAYLGGLDPLLHTPRRAMPRAHTPAGSVNIGGQQTAIASVPGPSGWHLIGRTPWRSFDLRHAQPFLFEAGDEVVFTPIDADAFEHLAAQQDDPASRPQPQREVRL